MMDVNLAVRKALEAVKNLFSGQELPNLALEEVEFDEERKEWVVAVGYDSPRIIRKSEGSPLFPSTTTTEQVERVYKQVRINADTGAFVSLRAR